MKNPRLYLVVIILLVLAMNYLKVGQDQNQHQVLKVVDGDTLLVDLYGQTETVRLIGVDTPETHHPSKPVQCFGPEASKYLEDKLEGEYVRLEADALSDNKDRYDRLLRYVYTQAGELVNLSLVKEGYGFTVTGFEHTKMAEFVAAGNDAKSGQIGLWTNCNVDESGKYPSTTSRRSSS